MKKYLLICFGLFIGASAVCQLKILPGAERMDVYVPLLKGKSVAVFANQTSMVGSSHLVDTLIKSGIKIIKIFSPEHGFRGHGDAGEEIGNYRDAGTGVQVVSLYGDHRKPTADELKDVDVMVFDIQDVGARFYTYISSLEYYIEASLENAKPLLILDRPNPNGFYVDGPVLDKKFKSFIGMQTVPVVYGMTIGEYAMMIAGENWLSDKANKKYAYYKTASNSADTPFHFLVIKCKNYDHNSKYVLPVRPSPNLPEIQSIYLYPSTCFFETTVLSEGRGTDKPFQYIGHPLFPKTYFKFTPVSKEGAKDPKLKDQVCYGWNLGGTPDEVLKRTGDKIQLKWLIEAYKQFPEKAKFFLNSTSLSRHAGNDILMQQIIAGKTEAQIRQSWEPALSDFKKIRKKYLMYADFTDNSSHRN